MLTCREVTQLVGSDALQHASLVRRIEVRAHLWMCVHCRAYARSLRQLAVAARDLARLEKSRLADADDERVERIVAEVRRAAGS